jgi:hypothetical protein
VDRERGFIGNSIGRGDRQSNRVFPGMGTYAPLSR